MILPENFRFSQASLQDFKDCRKRFQLRYIDRLAWPAIESEPTLEQEELMRLGAQFHRMIHQHQLGIDPDLVQAAVRDPELLRWWQNYLDHPIPDLPEKRIPEHVLTVPLGDYRLLAKMDLIAIEEGDHLMVVDWKTSRKAPGRKWLGDRLQTQVYRYVAAEAGAHLNGGQPLAPEQVSLVYWFANDPQNVQRFDYSEAEHAADRESLLHQIEIIRALESEQFYLTENERDCRFCPYRSLCGRGVIPGSVEEFEISDPDLLFDIDLDIEQIGEISF